MTPTLGAVEQITAPTRKRPAQTSRLPLRPSLSASFPPSRAPRAAPGKSSELTTMASENAVRFRSAFSDRRAPEMTPVSYPKSRPPRVEITVNLMRKRLWAPDRLIVAPPDAVALPPCEESISDIASSQTASLVARTVFEHDSFPSHDMYRPPCDWHGRKLWL